MVDTMYGLTGGGLALSFTGTVTTARSLHGGAFAAVLATPVITTAVNVDSDGQSSNKIANSYGNRIADVTGGTTLNRCLQVGPSPFYLIVEGSGDWTPAANETPIFMSEGTTPTLRQVKHKDGASISAGDKVMDLV